MTAAFHIRPFAFDRVFAGAPPAEAARSDDLHAAVAALELQAVHTRTGHEAALARARAEAFDAGVAQARAERDTALLAAIDALGASLENVDAQIADMTVRVTADAAGIALAAADHLAARALAEQPGAAIDEAIGRTLAQVARGTELQVRVHPDFANEVERLIGVRRAGDRRELRLHVVGDGMLAPGDACIAWDGGELTLDVAARSAAIREELDALLAPPRS